MKSRSRSAALVFPWLAAPLLLGCTVASETPSERAEQLPGPFDFAPSMVIRHVRSMQPGWLRVVIDYAHVDSKDVKVKLGVVGALDTGAALEPFAYRYDHAARRVVVDLRVKREWFEKDRTRRPKEMWLLTAALHVAGKEVAFAWRSTPMEIGLPTSLWAPERLDPALWSPLPQPLTVPGPGHPYSAYPALQFAVKRGGYVVGFVEVEEDRDRKALRLRQLATFDGSTLVHELAGGAEMPNNWGVHLTGRGVARSYNTAAEVSNPGRHAFATGGAGWSASFMDTPLSSHKVFRAPPITTEGTYQSEVLDNRGIAREVDPADRLDVIYFERWHLLVPSAGVQLQRLSGPPPEPWDPATHIDLAPAGWFPSSAMAYVASNGSLPLHEAQLPAVPPANVQLPPGYASAFAELSRAHLERSFVEPVAAQSPISRMLVSPSIEERRINDLAAQGSPPPPNAPPPSPPPPPGACALNAHATELVGTYTTCDGALTASACPTQADPIEPESFPPAPGYLDRLSLHDVLTPFLAGKQNIWGTCSTHADVQHREAVLNRYVDDLGMRRFAVVDGVAISIPEPRTAHSVGGYLSMLFTRVHTRNDSDDGGLPPTTGTPIADAVQYPLIPEAWWPAREEWDTGDDWVHRSGVLSKGYCQTTGTPGAAGYFAGFWRSGFCASRGTPPIGAYRAYSEQRLTHDLALDPLAQGPWSLARSYQPSAYEVLDFSDRDAAIQTVISELRRGVPVKFSFSSAIVPRGPGIVSFPFLQGGMTWYLPPELDACPLDWYRFEGGHALNIVGFYVRGPLESPDVYRSVFILQNNWGAASGHRGYFAINFAAFRRAGWSIERLRLRTPCASSACQGT
ncbi:MAG: hypothetical protein HYZ29_21410 [Myxococcales bacterium]|nr:hypothetical protein [Myxococcales bacterium]